MSATHKIELHLHLEGAAPPSFIAGLAAEKNHRLDGVFDDDGHYAFRDFGHFLQVYEAATEVLKTPDDFARLVRAVLEVQAEHGVVYTETFLSPDFCGGGDVAAWREYLHAMEEAAEQAEAQDGVILRGIVTCIRHFGPDKAKAAALCAAETRGDFIVGFGMAGDESKGRPRDFAYSFDMAREAELRLTCHAGEWGGPSSVREALADLHVERIGHGVRAIEDPALVDQLAENGTVLEVCPGSNVALGLYPDWRAHPIEKLHRAGVPVTVSTDDPPFFHTTMTHEFEMLSDAFDLDDGVFAELTRNALNGAFCDAATKTRLEKLIFGEEGSAK
ncbi:MAG: adenosine deaminase [Pseudomonadota bacterium]